MYLFLGVLKWLTVKFVGPFEDWTAIMLNLRAWVDLGQKRYKQSPTSYHCAADATATSMTASGTSLDQTRVYK